MVRFTDDANRFWLEQSLDKGEMPKRDGDLFQEAQARIFYHARGKMRAADFAGLHADHDWATSAKVIGITHKECCGWFDGVETIYHQVTVHLKLK